MSTCIIHVLLLKDPSPSSNSCDYSTCIIYVCILLRDPSLSSNSREHVHHSCTVTTRPFAILKLSREHVADPLLSFALPPSLPPSLSPSLPPSFLAPLFSLNRYPTVEAIPPHVLPLCGLVIEHGANGPGGKPSGVIPTCFLHTCACT